MTEKRFVNKGKDIFQYGEWWCSANGEHCADVIATAINELIKENGQLKQSYKEFEDECQSTFNAMSRKQNDLYRKNFKLKEENEHIKNTIKEAYNNERTHIGKSVLKQLLNNIEAIQ